MKLWNGYQWLEYSGEPVDAAVLATSAPPMALDPALSVITEDAAIPLVEAAHARYRRENEDTGEFTAVHPPKLEGVLPTPIATFHFDTSDEED